MFLVTSFMVASAMRAAPRRDFVSTSYNSSLNLLPNHPVNWICSTIDAQKEYFSSSALFDGFVKRPVFLSLEATRFLPPVEHEIIVHVHLGFSRFSQRHAGLDPKSITYWIYGIPAFCGMTHYEGWRLLQNRYPFNDRNIFLRPWTKIGKMVIIVMYIMYFIWVGKEVNRLC